MRIGIDIMGGDYAPEATTLGAIEARKALPPDVQLVLIGNKEKIQEIFSREKYSPEGIEIVHASQVIEMGEHPAKTFAQKPDSSISIGFGMLAKGLIDGFASAGNTGAVLVGCMYTVKSIPGIIRPAITASLPKENGKGTILLDVGINPDCRPDNLYQYAILGKIYCESVYNISNPRIGLLNIGSEEEKGNLLTKATFDLFKGTKDFNFIGNVEGNDLFIDSADVVICDGFIGNVVLKTAEGIYAIINRRGKSDEYFDRYNFENYGGTPVLGINSTVMIGHGASKTQAVKNMILHTREVIKAGLSEKIKQAFI
jgi:phosphate acyltransferase